MILQYIGHSGLGALQSDLATSTIFSQFSFVRKEKPAVLYDCFGEVTVIQSFSQIKVEIKNTA